MRNIYALSRIYLFTSFTMSPINTVPLRLPLKHARVGPPYHAPLTNPKPAQFISSRLLAWPPAPRDGLIFPLVANPRYLPEHSGSRGPGERAEHLAGASGWWRPDGPAEGGGVRRVRVWSTEQPNVGGRRMGEGRGPDRKSTRLNSSHKHRSRMPSSA